MQKFNYHCHTCFMDIFDGNNTADEMINTYENKGFIEVGISNHCIFHPTFNKMPFMHKQYFYDLNKFIDIYKRSFEWIDEAASKHRINVKKGLEVDFFPSKEWRNSFEKILKELKPDYLIGATHCIRSKNEDFLCGIYHLKTLPPLSQEEMDELVINYWKNIVSSIESGYFSFIAHPDYCRKFNLSNTAKWNDLKYNVIDALYKNKIACEVNTGGIRSEGKPYPDWWIVKEMINKEIPLLISDDAHRITDTASNFEIVENKLKEFNCKKRFSFNK